MTLVDDVQLPCVRISGLCSQHPMLVLEIWAMAHFVVVIIIVIILHDVEFPAEISSHLHVRCIVIRRSRLMWLMFYNRRSPKKKMLIISLRL